MRTLLYCRLSGLLCMLLLFFSGREACSQEPETCAEKLQSAQMLFERGQVEMVPGLISGCLESGFNREESLQAYKLIIQTYLFDDKNDLADSTMFAFVRKYPEYQVSPTDHSSFVSLFNNFRSKVIVQLSFRVGTNKPFTTVTGSGSVLVIPGKKSYSSGMANFFGAVEMKYKLTGKIELNAEIGYSQISFTNREPVSNPDHYAFSETRYRETQGRIEIPFTATYDISRFGKFTPYARLGIGPAFNISSYANGEFSETDRNGASERTGVNMRDLSRKFMDIMVQAGGGIKYKLPKGFFFAEVRSNFGLYQQSEFGGYTGENDDKHFFYMTGEDNFRLHTLNLNAGYTFIIYRPERKEK